jgi:3-hydroxyisobutyrate dehydrogenase
MGFPMAANLLRAGFRVSAYNRTLDRAKPLIALGATVVGSPAEAARDAEVVITMVSDTPDVEQVILGKGGIVEAIRPGAVVIDMSTISPRVTKQIAGDLAARGVEMLDAPVSGGVNGATEGTLSIMAGGKPGVFERCRPVFEAGQGQMTKLCNQITIASNLVAAAEAVAFAKKAGLDAQTMVEAVGAGAAGSWVMQVLGPKMVSHDFAPGFMVKLQQKDLRLVMEAACELQVSVPGAMLANQLFTSVEAAGGGDLGTQALVTVLEKLAGMEG